MNVKHPDITVKTLSYTEAFSMLARVKVALKINGVPQHEIDSFVEEALTGDYYHLIKTVKEMVVLE